MIQATPLDQLHMGLAGWRKKFGGACRRGAADRDTGWRVSAAGENQVGQV